MSEKHKDKIQYDPCRKCDANNGYDFVYDEKIGANDKICKSCGFTETIGFGIIR